MSTPSKVSSYDDVLKRVRAMQSKSATAQGDKVSDVKDPANTGTVTPPTHPSEATTNASLPGGNPMADNAAAPKSIESAQTKGTLEGTPSSVSGDAKDRAVDSPTAKLASDVAATVSRVKALLKTAGEAAKPTESKATAADPTDKGKAEPSKANGPQDLPPASTPATAVDNGEKKKEAAAADSLANDIKLSPEAYIKLASALLESEEGLILATRLIKEAKGAQAAQELIAGALATQEEFHKAASAEAQGAALADQLFKSASVEDQALMIKYAQVHGTEAQGIDARHDLSVEERELCKMAYAQGAMDGAAMADTGELPGGESEEPKPEDIVAVIEQLASSGQLPPDVAQQLIAELTGQGGAAAGAEGGEGAAQEQAETPAEETAEEKQAGAADPVLTWTGAHRKSASVEDKLGAEILRAALTA